MTMQQASTEIAARTAAIIDELKGLEGPLLPILHAIQDDVRLRAARGRAGDRRGAEPVARRGARRRHLLSRLPQRSRPAAMC